MCDCFTEHSRSLEVASQATFFQQGKFFCSFSHSQVVHSGCVTHFADLQVADALGLDEALPVARERLEEQKDISVRNMRTWMRETREDLARYRANASQSLQVRQHSLLTCLKWQHFADLHICVCVCVCVCNTVDWQSSRLGTLYVYDI